MDLQRRKNSCLKHVFFILTSDTLGRLNNLLSDDACCVRCLYLLLHSTQEKELYNFTNTNTDQQWNANRLRPRFTF